MNKLIGWILIFTAINYGVTLLFLGDFSLKECLTMASALEVFILLLIVGVWLLCKTYGVV